MITYKTLTPVEAFKEASQDTTWNEAERAALAAIARGLEDSNWNMLYMAGEIQKGEKEWDGTQEDLRPQTAGVIKDWKGFGCGKAWAKGHKEEFLVCEAAGGWNIGEIGI